MIVATPFWFPVMVWRQRRHRKAMVAWLETADCVQCHSRLGKPSHQLAQQKTSEYLGKLRAQHGDGQFRIVRLDATCPQCLACYQIEREDSVFSIHKIEWP